MSSFAIPGGFSGFVPPEAKPEPKSVRNRRAAARKAQQNALKQARTPNANAISLKPSPLKPVGGTGLLGIAAKATLIFAIVEGLFPRSTARSALDEIDPALLYPPSPEVIQTPPPPPFEGGQGVGVRYQVFARWLNNDGSRYRVLGVDVWGAINSIDAWFTPAFDWQPGGPGVVRIEVQAYDQHGNPRLWANEGTSSGRPPNPVILQIDRWDGQPDTDGNIQPEGGIISTATSIPVIPIENEFFQRDSYIRYDPLSKGRYKPNPPIPKPQPPKPGQVIDANPATTDGRVTQPVITPALVESPAQTTNRNNEIDNPEAPTDIPRTFTPTQQKSPIQETVKEKIKEPTKTVEWKTAGGRTTAKVTTETKADGTITTTTETPNGQVVSIKRTRPSNLKTSDFPTAKDTTDFDNQIGGQGKDLLIGVPNKSGTGIDTIPEPEALNQTPSPDPDRIGDEDLAKVAAIIAATSLTAENLKNSVEDAVCDSLDGGCMKSKLKDPLDGKLDGLNTALQGFDLSLLTTINNKLGDALPEGLSGFLTKAWASIRVNKVLDYINTALLLHNATMLSTNIASSLGDILSMIANNTINLIKNEDGSNIDINATIGGTIEQFLINTVGAENYNNASQTFHRTSRIVNAAANIMNTINFSLAGMAQGLETVGSYTGKIGNSLKKAGAVFENSYQWMSENLTVKTGKIGQVQAVLDGLEQVENVASDLENATSEFREVQENVTQIGSEFNKIKTEVNAQETAKTQLETTTKTNSQGAQPSASDYTPDPIG